MNYTVPMVVKVLKVLKAFQTAGPRLALTQVVSHCEISKATAFRILETLRGEGYLMRETRGSYRLTYQLLEIAMVVHARNALRRTALPHLEQLSSEVHETVNLGTLEGRRVVYAEVVESQHRLRIVPSVGSRAAFHATGLGKAVAAWLPTEEVLAIIADDGLKRYTANTITSSAALLKELARIHERGYGVDNEEEALQCVCVAAPVFDSRGSVAGAISISTPTSRTNSRRVHELGGRLQVVALAVSQEFGFKRETLLPPAH